MDIIALSSGESELAAVVKGAAEGLGMQSVLADFGHTCRVALLSDATAAIGMCKRLGLGRVRHLATADLWVQQRIRLKALTVCKLPGTENPADLLTKFLGRDALREHLQRLAFVAMEGRPAAAPLREHSWFVSQPAPYNREHR